MDGSDDKLEGGGKKIGVRHCPSTTLLFMLLVVAGSAEHTEEGWTGNTELPDEIVVSPGGWRNAWAKASGNAENLTTGTVAHVEERTIKTVKQKEKWTDTGLTEQTGEETWTMQQLQQPEEGTKYVEQNENCSETVRITEELEESSWQSAGGNEESKITDHTGEGKWHGRRACTPCNSTIEADTLTLPNIGFVCLEVSTPTRPPATCLVFFKGDFNLTVHLHQFPPTHWSVSS